MRYLFYTLICAVAIFATFSCGNSKQEKLRQQQIEDSIAKAKADSIAKIQALEKAKADSIARAKADSLEKINNPHSDLKLFDLRGPVKSCKKGTKDNYTILNFTELGELSHVTGWNKGKYKIQDGEIRFVSLSIFTNRSNTPRFYLNSEGDYFTAHFAVNMAEITFCTGQFERNMFGHYVTEQNETSFSQTTGIVCFEKVDGENLSPRATDALAYYKLLNK